MKKLIVFLVAMMITGTMLAQNNYLYVVRALGGLRVGKGGTYAAGVFTQSAGSKILPMDSIQVVVATKTSYDFHGADTTFKYIPVANQLNASGVLVQVKDSSGTATNSYTTGFDFANTSYRQFLLTQGLGSTERARTIPNSDGAMNLADNYEYYVAIYIPINATITGVKFGMATQGNYTADQYNGVALYSVSGGTYTLVASSADDANIWKASTGSIITKAFSSAYVAVPGVYMIGFIYNSSAQVTAPGLACMLEPAYTRDNLLTNSNKIFGYVNGKNALDNSQTGTNITAHASVTVWAVLY